MSRRHYSPESLRAPFGRYHQGVVVEGASRLLFLSGQLGIRADGSIPDSVEEQTAVAFSAIDTCLREAGMERRDVLQALDLHHRRGRSPGLYAAARRLGRRSAARLDPHRRQGAGPARLQDRDRGDRRALTSCGCSILLLPARAGDSEP